MFLNVFRAMEVQGMVVSRFHLATVSKQAAAVTAPGVVLEVVVTGDILSNGSSTIPSKAVPRSTRSNSTPVTMAMVLVDKEVTVAMATADKSSLKGSLVFVDC